MEKYYRKHIILNEADGRKFEFLIRQFGCKNPTQFIKMILADKVQISNSEYQDCVFVQRCDNHLAPIDRVEELEIRISDLEITVSDLERRISK